MLFGLSPAYKFLDNISYPCVEESSRALLGAFWRATGAKTIHLFKPESAGLADGSWSDPSGTRFTRMPAGLRALALRTPQARTARRSEGDTPERSTGAPILPKLDIEEFDSESALCECSLRMVQTARSPGVSGGIAFGMNEAPLGPSRRWELYLHRGPLPLLELRIAEASGFRPPGNWPEKLLAGSAADVIYEGGGGYLGDPRHVWLFLLGNGYVGDAPRIYLLLKRQKVFQWSNGESSDAAVAAGQRVQEACIAAWSGRGLATARPQKVSAWRWRQRRFVRAFDRLLLGHLRPDEFERLLSLMGTNLGTWLAAGV